ncbi:MAG: hypothetical protein LIP09_03610 [Bacteroidales bacterium]|nr:hypothetical protein [Bacteroidales bacterium]
MDTSTHTVQSKWLDTTSKTLSGVFSPLLVPTYACAVAFWITPLSYLPERTRLLVSIIIFLLTAALPMAAIIFMIKIGKVSDAAISNKRERGIPYVVTSLSYLAAAAYLGFQHAPHWLTFFFAGACFACLLALVINTGWKISAHATTMGGLCGMMLFIAFNNLGVVWMMWWISGVFLLTGAVCSARLFLHRHSPAQVYAGWIMGIIVEYFFMMF